MAKNENRAFVTLVCSECKNEARRTSKNKANTPERLELSKFCNVCKTHTKHVEKK